MADEKSNLKLDYIKYSLILLTIILIPIMFEFGIKNRQLFNMFYFYLLLAFVIIPLLCVLGYEYFFSGRSDITKITNYFILFLVVAFVLTIFYSQLSLYSTALTYVSYFFISLFILILVVGLAIIFASFTNYFKSLEGTSSFISYFIFYIPCLVIDFANYLIKVSIPLIKPTFFLFFYFW